MTRLKRWNKTWNPCRPTDITFPPTIILENPPSIITIIPRSGKLGYKFNNQKEHLHGIVAATESNVSTTNSEQRDTTQFTTDFRLASAHPLANQNIAMINWWLRSCSVGHDHCNRRLVSLHQLDFLTSEDLSYA
jgi:hypothetical protein